MKCFATVLWTVLMLPSCCLAATLNINWFRQSGNQGTDSIAVGDTVTWTLTDNNMHTVTSLDGGFTSSGNLQGSGTTFSVTFSSAGSFSYRCNIHNTMQGVISVSASPTRQPTKTPSVAPSTTAPSTARPSTELSVEPTISQSPTVAPSASPTEEPTFAPSHPTVAPTSAPTQDVFEYVQLTYPEVISSGQTEPATWSATLQVRAHRHSNNRVAFNTRAYCYNDRCSYPGPTISMKPGDNFTLTLENLLGKEDHGAEHVHNTMHSSNTTNVHTHGLHISANVDNVFLKADPGESLVYKYEIPTNHAPGLHWYHAHHHGSSALQIMGGLVGTLVIEDILDDISDLPASLLEADEHILVLTRMVFEQETISGAVSQGCGLNFACDPISQGPLCTGEEERSPWNLFREYSYPEFAAEAGSTLPIDVAFSSGWSDRNYVFINGQYRPTIEMNTSSPSILRMVHAHGAGPILLSMANDPTDACSITILAWDGVYLDGTLSVRSNETLNIVAAGRVDVEVTCTAPGLYKLAELHETIMWIRVNDTSSAPKARVSNSDLASIIRPWYLTDLREVPSADVNSTYSVFISQENFNPDLCQFWLGTGQDCSNISPYGASVLPNTTNNDNCAFSQFGGSRGLRPEDYIADNKLVTFTGALNEWTLYGLGSAFHPLHVHVNHMQIISTDSASPDGSELFYRPGQWRDTLPPVADKLTFRFIAADFTGETVMHCHFQRHEDLGMMDTYLIVNESEYLSYFHPTISPTTTPSATPTVLPTAKPTARPSRQPTLMPTTLTQTRLMFNITTKLNSINSTQLFGNSANEEAYVNALATYINISASDVSIVAVIDEEDHIRRLLRSRELHDDQNVYITTEIDTIVEYKGYVSSDGAYALYEHIKAAFTGNKWASGAVFGQALMGSASDVSATVELMVDSTYVPVVGPAVVQEDQTAAPTPSPTSDDGGGSTTIAFGGLGVFGVVVITFVIAALVCLLVSGVVLCKMKRSKGNSVDTVVGGGGAVKQNGRVTKQVEVHSITPTPAPTPAAGIAESTEVVVKKKKKKKEVAPL